MKIACVARVPWGCGAKNIKGTGFSLFCPREKWCESQNEERGGGGGEERLLKQNSAFSNNSVYQSNQSPLEVHRAKCR